VNQGAGKAQAEGRSKDDCGQEGRSLDAPGDGTTCNHGDGSVELTHCVCLLSLDIGLDVSAPEA
jgi:hypothetical protein